MKADRIFYSDSLSGRTVSYGQLIEELNRGATFTPYCKSADYYHVLKQLVLSLLSGNEITLLDSDFTALEVATLVGEEAETGKQKYVLPETEITAENLFERLTLHTDSWRVTLFTSGTTGLPKKVSHSFPSVARQVRKSASHSDDVWGFAYNPTHMAGLQVFFQALLNGNSMVRLFGLDAKDIVREINSKRISHISATPTFYRMLLPPSGVCPSVVRLTSGGEKFDGHTLRELASLFPNARITNVYASTEAGSLFASRGNSFVIGENLKGRVRITDGELLLHKSLLAKSSSVCLDGEWYHTGDLVEVSCESPLTFTFISRKTEMINVGGYKVNPVEVEERLRECPGVRDAFVYAKANRITGHIIMADVVRENPGTEERDLRERLRLKLQEFKIPRIIRFVTCLNTTRTGKISRQ